MDDIEREMSATVRDIERQTRIERQNRERVAWLQKQTIAETLIKKEKRLRIGFVTRLFVYACLFGLLFVFQPKGLSEGWINTKPLAQLTLDDLIGAGLWIAVALFLGRALFNPDPDPNVREAWGKFGIKFGLVLIVIAAAIGVVFLAAARLTSASN